MEQPRVSILIQSYKHRRFLDRCIKTAIDQTYKNCDISVIDDGSDDGSAERLAELSEQFQFRFKSQKNRGFLPTLNAMLADATGTYVCFQATDDWWLPEKIERQVEWLEAHPDAEACFTFATVVDENDVPLPSRAQVFSSHCQPLTFENIFLGRTRFCSATPLFRRSLFERIGLFDENRLIEDLWMLLEITRTGGIIGMLEQPLAAYRVHGSNTYTKFQQMRTEVMKIIDRHADHPKYKEARIAWSRAYYAELAPIDKKTALQILPSVFQLHPRFLIDCLRLFIPPTLWRLWRGR